MRGIPRRAHVPISKHYQPEACVERAVMSSYHNEAPSCQHNGPSRDRTLIGVSAAAVHVTEGVAPNLGSCIQLNTCGV